MSKRVRDYTEKREQLMEAAQIAFDILVDALRESIDLESLGDEKIKTAIQSKRVAFMDAYELLTKINELDRSLKGKASVGDLNLEGTVNFPEPMAERHIRANKK